MDSTFSYGIKRKNMLKAEAALWLLVPFSDMCCKATVINILSITAGFLRDYVQEKHMQLTQQVLKKLDKEAGDNCV